MTTEMLPQTTGAWLVFLSAMWCIVLACICMRFEYNKQAVALAGTAFTVNQIAQRTGIAHTH